MPSCANRKRQRKILQSFWMFRWTSRPWRNRWMELCTASAGNSFVCVRGVQDSTLARRKLKSDLALGGLLGKHEFLDGFNDVLNSGVVSFQAAIQFVDLGSKLAIFRQHFAHADECAYDKNAHFDRLLRIENSGRHYCAVLSKGVGRIATAA